MVDIDPNLKAVAFVRHYKLSRAGGASQKKSFELLQNSGYDKGFSTLKRHIKRLEADGYALQPVKNVGRKLALNPSQFTDLETWIFDQNYKNEPIKRKSVQTFIKRTWDIQVSVRTCGNYLETLKMSKKTCQVKTPGLRS